MSSANIVITTVKTETTEDSSDSSCDLGSSSQPSHSNSEVYKTALVEKSSSDEFELARDHFSTTFFSALDETIDYDIAELNAHVCSAKKEPVKKIPTTQVQVKTGRCNCSPSKRNLLAQRKLKLETSTAPKTETKTNNGSENIDKKYNIKVPEISAKYSSSGIIKIPIEVRLTLKQSSGDEEDLPEDPQTGTEGVKPPRDWPTIKCIYEDCCAWEYMETYLDELLDDPEAGEFPVGAHGTDLVFNGECTDHYMEPYHAVGYIYSEDQFQLPIDYDELIPPELLAKQNDSFGMIKIPEKDVIIEVVDDDSLIHWEDVCLPPLDKVEIAAIPVEPDEPIAPHTIPVPEGYIPPVTPHPDPDEPEKKKGKCARIFSCCGGEDDEDDDTFPIPRRKQTSLVFQPVPKTSLIYGHHCTENEPYTRQLLKAFPHHEKSDSPCSSVTEIPWQKILLAEAAKIRPIDITDKVKVKVEPSASATTICACASTKDTLDVKPKISVSAGGLCTCPSYKELLRNLPDKLDVKPDIKDICPANASPPKNTVSFRDNKLVTLYPPPNLQSKSKSGTPMLKEPVGMIKTILSGKSKSEEGIMRTKVTLSGKDLNRLMKSQGKIMSSNIIKGTGPQKLSTKQICPASSNVSSSHSAPVLPKQEVCVPETCPSNIKVEPTELSSHTIKADPVISALIACEAELKPVKQALNTVQQKLRNMNMPELDSIFSKGTELANVFLNKAQQNRCNCANRYASGYNPNPTMKPANVKFMNDRMTTYPRPMSSYPATYKSPVPSSTYVPQRPRPYVEQCPYYGQYQSTSQSSSCAPSVQNFSMWPNYDRRDLYPDERKPSKSALRRPGYREKQRVKYQRDQSEDWRSADRSERVCCCSSSNYSSRNGIQVRKSEDEMTFTSSSSPSEDSVTKTGRGRRRHRRLIPKVKSKNSGIVSRQSLCPFLEAMKSIMILDNKKTVKRGINGVSYDTKLSTKKIKNMRMHMRVRTSKLSKK